MDTCSSGEDLVIKVVYIYIFVLDLEFGCSAKVSTCIPYRLLSLNGLIAAYGMNSNICCFGFQHVVHGYPSTVDTETLYNHQAT